MAHPFEVGKTYRNRVGEYVVLSIDNNQMKIRYVNGGTLVTDVNLQARIWENIQFEEQMSRSEERRRLALEARLAARTRTRQARAKPTFGGFQESDFQAKKRGVSWTTRKELGRVLSHDLSQTTRRSFNHWPVLRQAAVHVALKDQYDEQSPHRSPAFFVAASEQGLYYGFHVGRPEGPLEDSWPWSALVAALSVDASLREALRKAMDNHKLSLDLHAMRVRYGLVGQISLHGPDFLWEYKDAQEGITRPINSDELVETLRTLEPERRCELYLGRHLSVEEAVKAGSAVSEGIVAVFGALLPIYNACVGI